MTDPAMTAFWSGVLLFAVTAVCVGAGYVWLERNRRTAIERACQHVREEN